MTDRLTAGLERDNPDGELLTEDPRELPQREEDEGARDPLDYITIQEDTRDPAEDAPPGAGDWHPGLEIRSDSDLGAALAWLRKYNHEANELHNRAEEEKRRVNEWAAPKISKLEDSAAHLQRRIEVYAAKEKARLLAHGGKTAAFPSGVIRWRERKVGAYRLDQMLSEAEARKRLVAWAQQIADWPAQAEPLLLPGDPKPNLDVIKAHLEAISKEAKARQTAPGLEFVPPGVTLEVKTDG